MCIATPMQVIRTEPGQAWVAGRGQTQRVNTALVGECRAGDWLLVFLGSAREAIDAERAAEVNALLDLVQGSMNGAAPRAFDAGFVLPSATSPHQLAQLLGQPEARTS